MSAIKASNPDFSRLLPTLPCLLALAFSLALLAGCSVHPPLADSPSPGPSISEDEEHLLSEVSEFLTLGNENLQDSLWFEASGHFDSAWTVLTLLGERDSLSPDFLVALDVYRDSLFQLLVETAALANALQYRVPWQAQLDAQIEDVGEERLHVVDSLIKLDLASYELPVPLPLPDRVRKAIAVFTGPGRGYFSKWLNRRSRFEKLILEQLDARDMPKDLLYLSMIESGYNPKAWSRAKASGIWQFISATGKRYGLEDDWWHDQRRDPVAATGAALSYLSDLYAEFGDWHLAMAAYNCGEGRIRRKLKEKPGATYWDLELPKETMFYVPKILAAMIIGNHPERYGFVIDAPEEPFLFDSLSVSYCVPIPTIAKTAGVDEEVIKALNPSLRRWCTPPNQKPFRIYLPPGTAATFAANFDKLDKDKLVEWHRHQVRRGENLGVIASRYGVSVSALKSSNQLRGNLIRAGQVLLIPAPDGSLPVASNDNGHAVGGLADSPKVDNVATYYKVQGGDNLFDIARRFGLSVDQLLALNSLTTKDVIHPGQSLRLRGNSEAKSKTKIAAAHAGNLQTHQVTNGESLFSISRHLGVGVEELREWNALESNLIKAGQVLKYLPPAATVSRNLAAEKADPKVVHKVQQGETVYQIARSYKVSVSHLLRLNGLNESSILRPGDELMVTAAAALEDGGSGARYYTVRSGDNLWDIAVRFGSTVEQIRRLNPNLPSLLKPGERVRVY